MMENHITAGAYQGLTAQWSYDDFGNRTAANYSGTLADPSQAPPIPGSASATYNANNQAQSATPGPAPAYDSSGDGDVTNDGQNAYAYDAEGCVCAVESLLGKGMYGYLYNAEGVRVAKGTIQLVSNHLSCDTTLNQFQVTASYILDPGGQQLTEMSWSGGVAQWAHTNVFAAGLLTATYSVNPDPSDGQPGILNFLLADWLGTRRAMTDYAGNLEESCHSLPYGEGEDCAPTPTEHLFTGKECDAESGNDYFGARYYASSMGRFMSPDPENYGANILNPQSWNMYSYAMNNPLINVDPDGRECVWDDGSYDSKDDPDSGSADKCSGLGGTWIGDDVFENSQYYRGDWSGDANSTLGGLVGDIQSCSAAAGGGQAASLLIADSFASGFSNDQTAYVLATAQWESGMGSNMTEPANSPNIASYVGKLGNANLADATTYRGRGYVQMTGKSNYQTWSSELGVNLVQHPTLAATPDIAAQFAVEGMDRGTITGVSLYNYVNPGGTNFTGARAVINGDGARNGAAVGNIASGFSSSLSGCR